MSCSCTLYVGMTVESTTEDRFLNHSITSLSGEGCITQRKQILPAVKEASLENVTFAVLDSAKEETIQASSSQFS